MGHQGEAAFEGLLGIFQLQVALAFRKAGEDLAEMAIHGLEGFQEGLLAQGGHGFDPQQQLFALLAEDVEAAAKFVEADLQLLEFFKGEHVDRFKRFHAFLQATEVLLQGLQARLAYGLGNNRQRIGQLPAQGFEPEPQASVLFGQGEQLLPQPLQIPLLLLQGQALGGELGLGRIAGAAPFAEAFLQLLLLGLQGAASLLFLLVLLAPLAVRFAQRRHGLQQPLLLAGEGLQLLGQPLPGPGSARAGLPARCRAAGGFR